MADTHTDKSAADTDKLAGRHTDGRQTDRQAGRQTHRQAGNRHTDKSADRHTDKSATDTQTSWQQTHRQVGRRQSGTMTTMMMIIDDDTGKDGLSKPRETCFWVQPEHSATIKEGHPQLALCVDRHAIRHRSGGDPTVCWKRNHSTLIGCNKNREGQSSDCTAKLAFANPQRVYLLLDDSFCSFSCFLCSLIYELLLILCCCQFDQIGVRSS